MKIMAVVPAYNEEKRIERVLRVLKSTSIIDDILVIDDGSDDMTSKVVKDLNVNVVRYEKNCGKSSAVEKSSHLIDADVVFFCDADLVGLTSDICERIINPVLNKNTSMSVGLRDYGRLVNIFAKKWLIISGERAVSRNTFKESLKSKHFVDYGMETVMNYYCKFNNKNVKLNIFPYGHTHLTKKRNFYKGLRTAVGQVWEIIKVEVSMRIFGWS